MKNIKVILLFFLLSVIPFSSEAQISEKSLFNVVELDDRNFSINELAKVKSIKRSPVYNAIYGVILRSISNSITNTGNGALVIRLPGIKDALIACPKSFNYQDDSNFAWCGDFKDSPGELSLYSHEGLVAGRINIKGRIFEIQPTSKNKGLLLEINSSFLNKAYDMPPSGIDTLIDDGGGSSGGGGEPVVVSVLVLYTSQVLEYQNNPIAFANSVFGTLDPIVTNLDNSLMFNLVGVRQLDDFEEVWNDIELTMNNFVENQTVAYYRDLDRADIVVLLTNATPTMNQGYIIWDPFTQTNLHVLGMANCIDCDASKPYAIVDAPFAINHLTFAHEVSHLFGARHQWAADNTNTYAHA